MVWNSNLDWRPGHQRDDRRARISRLARISLALPVCFIVILADRRDRDLAWDSHGSLFAGRVGAFFAGHLGWCFCFGRAIRPAVLARCSTPSKFQSFSEFFRFFIPSLTGVVGFWATVALNIPDLRVRAEPACSNARPALGLPATMTFYAFIGMAVTSATTIIFGQALWDPVDVLAGWAILWP